ncbi:MAG: methylenetetrahydrofolate reductase [Acidimicrobiales bacterium]
MVAASFEVISEIEPATRPDLTRVRHQVGVLAPVSDAFLIPDNHLGRATVSSIAVAHEVANMGVRSVACLNCRDRNRLGFRRDLLTAAAYGVDRFLLVFGDQPVSGGRSNDLTVRAMIEEVRSFGASEPFAGHGPFSVGVTSRIAPLPHWKRDADFILVQASFDLEELLRWRESLHFEGKVLAGVIVIASAGMAKQLAEATGQIDIPENLVDELTRNRDAGVDRACSLMAEIESTGAFDGAHLIPVGRYRAVAARLEHDGWRRSERRISG